MKSALIVAGNSFVGQHLHLELQRAGWRVTSTVRSDRSLDSTTCDLTDHAQVNDVVGGTKPDCVFQCAGATTASDPGEQYRLHVHGTMNLLRAVARHAPAAPVQLFGSAAEYGAVPDHALPIGESYPGAPRSFFGASKLAQTDMARAAAQEWNLRILVVRPFNIIGPGLPPQYFATALAQRLRTAMTEGRQGEFPIMNAEATRDLVDVRDVVQAAIGLMSRAAPAAGSMELYNIASGLETSVLAIAKRLCELAGGFRAVVAGPGKSRSGIQRSCGDASRLRNATGWVPRIDWQRSIYDLWKASTPSTSGA
jgi:nucleoside-diphosphate-sugar epimerase